MHLYNEIKELMTSIYSSFVSVFRVIIAMMLIAPVAVISQEHIANGSQNGVHAQEIVILVDSSSTMQSVDPLYLIRSDIADFTARVDPDSSISLMMYDDSVNTLVPLSLLSKTDSLRLKEALGKIQYTGESSDLVMAIERAVYDLNFTGQKGLQKFIILISGGNTTGIQDESIRPDEALITALSNSDIEIHAVTLSAAANHQILQILGRLSNLHRHTVKDIAELGETLKQINLSLETKQDRGSVQQSQPSLQSNNAQGLAAQATNPATNNGGGQSFALGTEERTRTLLIIAAAVVLFITLITLIILLFIQYRKFNRKPDFAESDAYLRDIHGLTPKESFRLGKKATMLGRVAGKDSGNIDYIVIAEPTIGRRHAVIEYKDYGYWITDQGSINGTFVNDIPINSEIRLKHGDMIKLHKFEFEFAIPELEDSTMTRVSETVIAHGTGYGKPSDIDLDINEVKDSMKADKPDLDLDFSSAASEATQQPEKRDSGDETLSPDFDSTETQARVKTINPNDHLSRKITGRAQRDDTEKESKKKPWDDLTILPGEDDKRD